MSLTEAAEGACMPVNQIYGLEESKALMVRFDLDVQIAPNVTQKVHTGWLSPPDDMLLREKMDDGATVAQSSQVLKTFVYREHLVVHTSIPFDRWCQGDCGCVEKGYFGNVQGLTTGGSTNFLQQGGLIAIIVILPILAVAVCLCVIRCRRLRRAKVYQAGGKGGKGKGGGSSSTAVVDLGPKGEGKGELQSVPSSGSVTRQHRPPPMPPGSGSQPMSARSEETPTPARPLQDRLAMAPPANPETPGGSGGFGMTLPPAPPPGADADGRERLPPLPPRAAAYATPARPTARAAAIGRRASPPLDDTVGPGEGRSAPPAAAAAAAAHVSRMIGR